MQDPSRPGQRRGHRSRWLSRRSRLLRFFAAAAWLVLAAALTWGLVEALDALSV